MRVLQRIARDALPRVRDPRTPTPRREFLRRTSALAFAGAVPVWMPLARGAESSKVVIVGAGLAGLTAAYELKKAGIRASIVEGSPRVGGRCWTERSAFADGQVAERGGELIDTTHEDIRALAQEFALPLDDLLEAEPAGSQALAFFDGSAYTTADVNRDFAQLLPRLSADAKSLGDELPTYRKHTTAQRELDRMSATQWIASRVAGGPQSRFGRLLINAYGEELGADPDEISAITIVSLLAGSPADRFSPYEESDQRFHIRGGNDQLVTRLAAAVDGQIATGSRLVGLARGPDGRYRLTLLRDMAEREEIADRVILALPFTLLREVDTSGAGFSARKTRAIRELGMGRNCKLQLQFDTRAWQPLKSTAETRVDDVFQTSWEVTRAQPGRSGIVNCFSGGSTATRAGEGEIEERAREALAMLDAALPGTAAHYNGRAIRNAWERYPWTRGSYALFKPGQYSTLNGALDTREGRVHFAGEHTSADWQGYMNGGVESGQRAAREVAVALGARRAKAA